MSSMLLEESKESALEAVKRLSHSRNDTQLWMCLVVKVKSDAVKKFCLGTWNVRSMNQGKLEVVKQEMVRENIDILGITE